MLSFETLSPAPRSSLPFFFSACRAGVDMLGSVQPLKRNVQAHIAFGTSSITSVVGKRSRTGWSSTDLFGNPCCCAADMT
jgi:hypothetical protein